GNLHTIYLRAVLYAFLTAGERLGDGLEAHALPPELVKLLDLVLPPWLAMTFEHLAVCHVLSPFRLAVRPQGCRSSPDGLLRSKEPSPERRVCAPPSEGERQRAACLGLASMTPISLFRPAR